MLRLGKGLRAWKGAFPRDPASGYVLRPCCLTELRGAVVPTAEVVVLGSLEDPGSCGKLAASQPGCRAPSCNEVSKMSAPTQKVYVSQVPQPKQRMC